MLSPIILKDSQSLFQSFTLGKPCEELGENLGKTVSMTRNICHGSVVLHIRAHLCLCCCSNKIIVSIEREAEASRIELLRSSFGLILHTNI